MAEEKKILLQIHIKPELDQFICQKAARDGRTRAGVVRRWLELIKEGRIDVEAV